MGMKISTVLDQIDLGSVALPEFQRGYVWNREQVKGLVRSLYKGYPVGSLLVWETATEGAPARAGGTLAPGVVKLLLDGQQRITSLYGLIRGCPPSFFDGNAEAFTGLYFHLMKEDFEFYAPTKMKGDPLWVGVKDILGDGGASALQGVVGRPEFAADSLKIMSNIQKLARIRDIELHVETVTGREKSLEEVVDIFNRVNSGGTKLSQGDLALAKQCAGWTDARRELRARIERWKKNGFNFKLEWLLRCITAQECDSAFFTSLEDLTPAKFAEALPRAERGIDTLLNMIGSRLGLDHDRVLGSPYAFPLMLKYLAQKGGRVIDPRERDKLLYWYVHTFLWGRYSGSTESVLNKDLAAIREPEGALDRLIAGLRQERGSLGLSSQDFEGWSQGARFYPFLYLLGRVGRAKDWESGAVLSNLLLGRFSRLHLHHIFPKAQLYKHGYTRPEVNALANFTLITEETNIRISDRDPADYLAEVEDRMPGALASHSIPTDRTHWAFERYRDFLAARRELLAQAGNGFLDSLLGGQIPEPVQELKVTEREIPEAALAALEGEGEFQSLNAWLQERHLPPGQPDFEWLDPQTGQPGGIFDLAWPDGLQTGLSGPVAIILDGNGDTQTLAARSSFRVFTALEPFQHYVRHEILGEE